jgi:hypothetical protein
MSLRASPVSCPPSPMDIDNDQEPNPPEPDDHPLLFRDNDQQAAVPDLPRAMRPIIDETLPIYRPFDLGPMKVECPHCHAFHFDCEKKSNSKRGRPQFGSCCLSGKVTLPYLNRPPGQLGRLFSGDHLHSNHFLDNARAFNNAFAFTSMSAKIDRSLNVGGAPPVFKIQGALYHNHGQMLPHDNNSVKYAQVYFYQDPQQQLDRRMANNTRPGPTPNAPPITLNQHVMSDIQVNNSIFIPTIFFLTFLSRMSSFAIIPM